MTKNLKGLLKLCLDQRLKTSDTAAQTLMYCGDLVPPGILNFVMQAKFKVTKIIFEI